MLGGPLMVSSLEVSAHPLNVGGYSPGDQPNGRGLLGYLDGEYDKCYRQGGK